MSLQDELAEMYALRERLKDQIAKAKGKEDKAALAEEMEFAARRIGQLENAASDRPTISLNPDGIDSESRVFAPGE